MGCSSSKAAEKDEVNPKKAGKLYRVRLSRVSQWCFLELIIGVCHTRTDDKPDAQDTWASDHRPLDFKTSLGEVHTLLRTDSYHAVCQSCDLVAERSRSAYHKRFSGNEESCLVRRRGTCTYLHVHLCCSEYLLAIVPF